MINNVISNQTDDTLDFIIWMTPNQNTIMDYLQKASTVLLWKLHKKAVFLNRKRCYEILMIQQIVLIIDLEANKKIKSIVWTLKAWKI